MVADKLRRKLSSAKVHAFWNACRKKITGVCSPAGPALCECKEEVQWDLYILYFPVLQNLPIFLPVFQFDIT